MGFMAGSGLLFVLSQTAWGAEGLSQTEFFEKRIRPLLADRCYSCHSAKAEKLKAGLRLDSRAALLLGGESGVVVVPGRPDQSRLIEAVRYGNVDLQMPPKGKLLDQQIADLEIWVKEGVPWPEPANSDGSTAATAGAKFGFDLQQRRQQHWAWRPILRVNPPAVRSATWVRNSVDPFILARLEEHQLSPAPAANRATLLRRLHFDLTGLPPTPAETEAFLADSAADAYERVVDRLLAAPEFGERWARHWLDLVRYAETLGHEFDYPNPNAWRYRDYVIRAFNTDVPYDQLMKEHLAGDLIAQPRRNPAEGFNESVIGTAFYWLGQRDHSPVDVRQHQAELIDNQIDVLSKTFLGLTVACARCHDHKFDAISSRDYYALYGILSSSRYNQAGIEADDQWTPRLRRLLELKHELRQAVAAAWLTQTRDAAECLVEASARFPSISFGLAAREGDVVYLDTAQGLNPSAGWFFEGEAFCRELAAPGDFVVGSPTRAVDRIITASSIDSSLLSRRLQGTLRSPTFAISNRFVHILAAGHNARINLPVDNFTMIRDPIYGALKRVVDSNDYEWITIDAGMWEGHRAYLEFSDISAPDPGDDAHREGFPADGYLAVRAVLFSNNPRPPERACENLLAKDASGEGLQRQDLLHRFEDNIRVAVRTWLDALPGGLSSEQAALLNWLVQNHGLKASPSSECVRLAADYAEVEATIPDPVRVPSMVDGTGLDENVFIRGNHKTPGESAPRGFLEAIAGTGQRRIESGSGRLELARWMTDRANPFPARVMVNRVWLHLFGRGLVPTPDDFGSLGQPPSHPELLDWLAEWFRTEGGWSTKSLIRMLVMSSTYQMSSRPADLAAEENDPDNLLWHRMPVRRLEGEVIRDAILAISQRLDLSRFGPPVPIHLTEFMDGRGKPATSGPLDGAGRRSIYIEVRRNFISPMMRAFDMPVPFTTVGRRTVSNVPAQSLILMNDPFVAGQARRWAESLLSGPAATSEERIQAMFEVAFARPASPAELSEALEFIERQSRTYRSLAAGSLGSLGSPDNLATWTDLCQVLFNLKEFIFVN
jgi:hypothetical protein